VGFEDVWIGGHRPFGLADAERVPLFTAEVIEAMRRTIPPERHDRIATSVIVKARKPNAEYERAAAFSRS
jgi:hypothetical protein